jgi:predicted RNase H-like HicB family nuclease
MADGATYEAAIAAVKIVIQEWVQTARELGHSIFGPKGRLLYA